MRPHLASSPQEKKATESCSLCSAPGDCSRTDREASWDALLAGAFRSNDPRYSREKHLSALRCVDVTTLVPIERIENAVNQFEQRELPLHASRSKVGRHVEIVRTGLAAYTASSGPYTLAEIYSCFGFNDKLRDIRKHANLEMLTAVCAQAHTASERSWLPPTTAQLNLLRRAGACAIIEDEHLKTALHFLCESAIDPSQDPDKRFRFQEFDSSFAESVDWMCEQAPMALLSVDDTDRTPICIVASALLGVRVQGQSTATLSCFVESLFFQSLSVGFTKCFSTCATQLMHVCRGIAGFRDSIAGIVEAVKSIWPRLENIPQHLKPFFTVVDWIDSAMGGAWELAQDEWRINAGVLKGGAAPEVHDLIGSSIRLQKIVNNVEAKMAMWQAEEISMQLSEFESRCARKARCYEERIAKLEAEIEQRVHKSQKQQNYAGFEAATSDPSSIESEKGLGIANAHAERHGEWNKVNATASHEIAIRKPLTLVDAPECTDEAKAVLQSIRQNRLVDCDVGDASEEIQQGLGGIRRSLCAAVERLATDLYANQCHCLWELLQNADDNKYAEDSTPWFNLSLGRDAKGNVYLLAVNNEDGLRSSDVKAICDVNASLKGSGQTGHKGIGWKSVFRVTDCPHLLSHAFAFKFDVAGPLGKLAYVTPTYLTDEEYGALPEEVRAARDAGYTVNYLPLRCVDDAVAAEVEMREIAQQHLCLIFLRRLRRISLTFLDGSRTCLDCANSAYANLYVGLNATSAVQISENSGPGAETEQYIAEFLLHRHQVSLPGGAPPAELVLAFPAAALRQDDADVQVQPLFTFLPVRAVGFCFAIQGPFDLVADRGNLHGKSIKNRALCAALPEAFAASLRALPMLKSSAFALLGQETLEAQWLGIRRRLMDTLKEIDCVPTEPDGELALPRECLLYPESPRAAELSKLLPPECLWQFCGRRFVQASWAAKWRPHLQRLDVEELGMGHWIQLLKAPPQKEGIDSGEHEHLQHDKAPQTISQVAMLANDMGFFRKLLAFLGDMMSENDALLESFAEVPLLPDCRNDLMCLADGPIFEAFSKDFSKVWQKPLEKAGLLRVIRPELVAVLDAPARFFLMHAGIKIPSGDDIVSLCLQWHLDLSESIDGSYSKTTALEAKSFSNVEESTSANKVETAQIRAKYPEIGIGDVIAAIWTSLACLRSEFLKGVDGLHVASRERHYTWWGLGCAGLVVPTSFARKGFGPCQQLTCPTYLGEDVGRHLPRDVMIAITSFVYGDQSFREDSGILADFPPEDWCRRPSSSNSFSSSTGHADVLEWEAFFVDALGMRKLQPCSLRQRNAGTFLTFHFGGRLSSSSWWSSVSATPRGFAYLRRRLHSADRVELTWLKGLRARNNVEVSQLFLCSPYIKYGGEFLQYIDLNLPSDELVAALRRLGIATELSGKGLRDSLRMLERDGSCDDVGVYADIYAALQRLPEAEQRSGHVISGKVEKLRIFKPPKDFVNAADCVWVDHGHSILRWLAKMHVLQPIYGRFDDACREWITGPFCCVPHQLDFLPADRALKALQSLFEQVDIAKRVPARDAYRPLDGIASPTATLLLAEMASVALSAYRHLLSACDDVDKEKASVIKMDIRFAFRRHRLILMARSDWSKQKRLTAHEVFWNVASDLSDSRVAKLALKSQYHGDDIEFMRRFFVDIVGIQEILTRDDLERRVRVPLDDVQPSEMQSSFMEGFSLADFEEVKVISTGLVALGHEESIESNSILESSTPNANAISANSIDIETGAGDIRQAEENSTATVVQTSSGFPSRPNDFERHEQVEQPYDEEPIPSLEDLLASLDDVAPLPPTGSSAIVETRSRQSVHEDTRGPDGSDGNQRNLVGQQTYTNSSARGNHQVVIGQTGDNAEVSNEASLAANIESVARDSSSLSEHVHEDGIPRRRMERWEYEELLLQLEAAQANMATWQNEIQTVRSELNIAQATRDRYLNMLRKCYEQEAERRMEGIEDVAG